MAKKKRRFRRWKKVYPRTLEHPGGTIAIIYSHVHARTIGRDYVDPRIAEGLDRQTLARLYEMGGL